MLFRMWESVNSYNYDDRMLSFLAQLAEMHVDPGVSDPQRIENIPDDEVSEGEGRPNWPKEDLESRFKWSGLFSDVGMFSEADWSYIMAKCMASMGMLRYACNYSYTDCPLPLLPLNRDPTRRFWLLDHRAQRRWASDLRDEPPTEAELADT